MRHHQSQPMYQVCPSSDVREEREEGEGRERGRGREREEREEEGGRRGEKTCQDHIRSMGTCLHMPAQFSGPLTRNPYSFFILFNSFLLCTSRGSLLSQVSLQLVSSGLHSSQVSLPLCMCTPNRVFPSLNLSPWLRGVGSLSCLG